LAIVLIDVPVDGVSPLIRKVASDPCTKAEATRIDDERLDCFEPSDGLWGLDIGVASATIALSALGAIPVGSCNAGGFGGHHQGAFPYVSFFLGGAPPGFVVSISRQRVSDCEATRTDWLRSSAPETSTFSASQKPR
jgi:hypothetical protein